MHCQFSTIARATILFLTYVYGMYYKSASLKLHCNTDVQLYVSLYFRHTLLFVEENLLYQNLKRGLFLLLTCMTGHSSIFCL